MRRRVCGSGAVATVETADIEAMLPWLDWAFQTEIEAQAQAA
jgi:phosphoserine aminotransferase